MLNEISLAVIQAATEFLPISSSGHLALFSNLISEPDLFLFTVLHLASLVAVLIFTRKEIYGLLSFNDKYKKLWIYLIIATIPAALFGYFFKNVIGSFFSSYLYLGVFFIFNSCILLSTRFVKSGKLKLKERSSLFVGLFQCLGLFPGVSRSGMTISSALLNGVDRETTVKFSFLLFIPLSIGAFILESGGFYINTALVVSFFTCMILSFLFLNFLMHIVKKDRFWMFSIYTFILGVLCILLNYFNL